MDQRVNVKFCYKLGKSATETYQLIKKVYGKDSMDRSSVFRWFSRFRKGRECVKDEPRPGGTRTTRTPENITRIAEIIKENPHASKRLIAKMTGINEFTVYQIITEDLGHKRLRIPDKKDHNDRKKAKRKKQTNAENIDVFKTAENKNV